MKLYLNGNIVEGTPEELATYQELLKEKGYTELQEGDNESVEEKLYDYYEVVNPDRFASSIKKGTILKRTSITHTGYECSYINMVTSTGLAQRGLLKDSVIKPIICKEFTADRFDFAKRLGVTLTVDTDFEWGRDI